MIKAVSGTALILGITEFNVGLLKQDRPIRVDLHEMGIADRRITDIIIFYGRDEEHLLEQIKPMTDPSNLIVHRDNLKNHS